MLDSLRIAFRSLSRRPAVAGVAVLSLATGIGVNSAVFTIVDSIFLRPPAVAKPESLVEIRAEFKDGGGGILDWSDVSDIAAESGAFAAVTASMGRGGLWRNGDEMTLLLVDAVGDNYSEMLGVEPVLGQFPSVSDAAATDPPVVLSNWFWRERMGARPDVIGQRMEFRDQIWRIAAVLPPRFRGLHPDGQRHLWITASAWARYWRRDLERGSGQFEAIARLRPGVSVEQAQARLEPVAARIEAADSRVPKGRRLVAASLAEAMRERLRPGLFVLAVVALVLLIACANVAAVLLAHAEARRREIGLRLSLGAGTGALLRQFLAESGVLALCGTAAGLLLAAWLLSVVPALAPPSPVPLNFAFRLDRSALVYTSACALATLALFALAPFAFARRVPLLDAISGARSAGRTRRSWFRSGLVVGQVVLSVVLVGGAAVMVRILSESRDIYPGFDTSRPLALVWVSTQNRAKSGDVAFRDAAGRIASVGGVEAVTWARHLPLVGSGSGAAIPVIPEGAAVDTPPAQVYFNLVGPDFFEITGARIVSGRAFTGADHASGARGAIINAEAARRFWRGSTPLGRTLRKGNEIYQVIGIAADGRVSGLHERPRPALYLPSSHMEWGECILIAKTRMDPAAVLKAVAKAAGSTHDLRVYDSLTLAGLLRQALYEDWIPTVMGAFLAIVGLLLAAGGLYGAVSYSAERRLSEFGVRIALGAKGAQVAGLVLRQAALLCVAGVPPGVAIFFLIYRYYEPTLLRSRPADYTAICAASAITIATVLAGALLPAIRAARLDPVEVLRAE